MKNEERIMKNESEALTMKDWAGLGLPDNQKRYVMTGLGLSENDI